MEKLLWEGKPFPTKLSPYISIQISFFMMFSIAFSLALFGNDVIALLVCNIVAVSLFLLVHIACRYYKQKNISFFIKDSYAGIIKKDKIWKRVRLGEIHSIAYIQAQGNTGHIILNYNQSPVGVLDENQLDKNVNSMSFASITNGYELFQEISKHICSLPGNECEYSISSQKRYWKASEVLMLLSLVFFTIIAFCTTLIFLPFGIFLFFISCSLLSTFCKNVNKEIKQKKYMCGDTVFIKQSGVEMHVAKNIAGQVVLSNGTVLYGNRELAATSVARHLLKNVFVFGDRIL